MSLFMRIVSFFIPAIMILFGLLMWFVPPKDKKNIYGYRSKRSMASQDAWDYAQVCMGKTWLIVGILLIFVTLFLLPRLFLDRGSLLVTILSIQCVCLFLPIAWVEFCLKKLEK